MRNTRRLSLDWVNTRRKENEKKFKSKRLENGNGGAVCGPFFAFGKIMMLGSKALL